jgi:hypothetical protein
MRALILDRCHNVLLENAGLPQHSEVAARPLLVPFAESSRRSRDARPPAAW